MKVFVLVLSLFFAIVSCAHPGKTAADGCHYCRSNCDKYGLQNGQRHSHKGATCNEQQNVKASADLKYKRKYFKHWVDNNKDCRNKRADILKERSLVNVNYKIRKDGKMCIVSSGKWNDYYYPEVLTDASLIDIDHIVPLKHAWQSGASKWSSKKREIFANDPLNLVITSRSYNRQKGAQTPLTWSPSTKSYSCKYLRDWIKVKRKYKLTISQQVLTYQKKLLCN